MPRPPADLIGMKFHKLTVMSISDKRSSDHRVLYECRCDCGNIVYALAGELKRGRKKECEYCKSISHSKDLTGQVFGRLTVIDRADPPSSRSKVSTWHWKCRCECGNIVVVSTNALTTGNTKSCGCIQVEKTKSLYVDGTAPSKLVESSHPRVSNTSGVTGVYFDSRRSMWVAEIMFKKKKIWLGRFPNIESAKEARLTAEEKYFGTFLDELKRKTIEKDE